MKRFSSVEDVLRHYENLGRGTDRLPIQYARVSRADLQNYAPIVEKLLATDYNNLCGFSFSEILEAVSTVISHPTSDYLKDTKAKCGVNASINENFLGTTQAQAPFPIPNEGLVLSMYNSVLPYITKIFDLKGVRGYIYYMTLKAINAQGNVSIGDLMASPTTLSKQAQGFVSTRIPSTILEPLVAGTTDYTITIPGAPIAPQSLEISIDGQSGLFKDFSSNVDGTAVSLQSVGGDLGKCVVNLNTGIGTISLTTAPVAGGLSIRGSYNRDVQTEGGAIANMAKVAPVLENAFLEARDYTVQSETNLQQERLSQIVLGTDWDMELEKLMHDIYDKEIANSIIADMFSKAPGSSINPYDIAPNVNTGDNRLFNTQFFGKAVTRINTSIMKASGNNAWGGLSTYITGIDLLPILRDLPGFVTSSDDSSMGGPTLIGTYHNTPVIMTYDTSSLSASQIMGIYKSNKQEFLTASVFGTFILPLIREVFDLNNLSINKKQLIASAAQQTLVPNLIGAMTVQNLDQVGLA
jgi:hypothetical protein